MHMHPDIAALRSDIAAQRRVQAHMRKASLAWLESPLATTVKQALERFASGEAFCDCEPLPIIIGQREAAMELVEPFTSTVIRSLRREPLGEVPHRYRIQPGIASVQLMFSGRAALNLVAYEKLPENTASLPASVMFQDRESYELILSGGASGTLHRLHECSQGVHRIETSQTEWHEGQRVWFSSGSETRQIISVDGVMVTLQLTRVPAKPGPSREFRLSDCTLLQSASGDKKASDRIMALSVLGAMEHRSAIGPMIQTALHRDESPDVRWEAVRQVLGIDARQGMALLQTMSGDARDILSSPANALQQSLTVAQPELSRLQPV